MEAISLDETRLNLSGVYLENHEGIDHVYEPAEISTAFSTGDSDRGIGNHGAMRVKSTTC
jgi:hypothetical protein